MKQVTRINREKLTDYERRTYDRIISMWSNLVLGGMTHEDAVKRIIRDLKRGKSTIKPSYVRLVLSQ